MKVYADMVKQIVLTVVVQRIAGFAVDRYVMPVVEKLPTSKKKPFGFS